MASASGSAPTNIHDVIVATITRYYQFLQRLHGDMATLEYPPEGGWPEMTSQLAELQNLGPESLRILREIPYFRGPTQIVPECHARSRRAGFKKDREGDIVKESWPDCDRGYPPHIFTLAEGGYRSGSVVAIDARRGVVIWHKIFEKPIAKGAPEPDAPTYEDLNPDEGADKGEAGWREWREAPTFRIETYFAMAEEQLQLLNWVPLVESAELLMEELFVYGEPSEEQQARIQIMRDAGWPGENWDSHRAREATRDWDEVQQELEIAEDKMRELEASDAA